jgi:hypothetical protein
MENQPGAFFTFNQAMEIKEVTCETTASDEKVWGDFIGMKIFHCPKGCTRVKNNIFNNDSAYFYKSSVCQAAIHSGKMTDLGGEGYYVYEKPLKMYKGNFAAGINGGTYDNSANEGYSIKIAGSHVESTNYFVDNVDNIDDVNSNWEGQSTDTNKNGPADWKVVDFNGDVEKT